jgi:type II secretory pathway pseudopilin PulG
MRKLSKSEKISISVIFLVLIAISIPNFVLSLRRARDQVRKDDMGALEHALGGYLADFGSFPVASEDGRIMACKNPNDEVEVNDKGRLVVNFIPCEWGQDGIFDLTPGSTKTYMKLLPREPDYQKGSLYHYFSDGKRYQIFVSLEGKDDVEYDPEIISRNLMCGNVICNAGRYYGCETGKTLEQCEQEAQKK